MRKDWVKECVTPYLWVDSVLPVSLTGNQSSHLKHPRQSPDVQLQELFRVVVVGQNRDVHPVHPDSVASHSQTDWVLHLPAVWMHTLTTTCQVCNNRWGAAYKWGRITLRCVQPERPEGDVSVILHYNMLSYTINKNVMTCAFKIDRIKLPHINH